MLWRTNQTGRENVFFFKQFMVTTSSADCLVSFPLPCRLHAEPNTWDSWSRDTSSYRPQEGLVLFQSVRLWVHFLLWIDYSTGFGLFGSEVLIDRFVSCTYIVKCCAERILIKVWGNALCLRNRIHISSQINYVVYVPYICIRRGRLTRPMKYLKTRFGTRNGIYVGTVPHDSFFYQVGRFFVA